MARFKGSNSADQYTGTSRGDRIYGRNGDDTLNGMDGNDLIDGGNGNDQLFGGNGRDLILGGNGNDLIDGGADNDWLFGGTGKDTILGGDGNDVIFGDSVSGRGLSLHRLWHRAGSGSGHRGRGSGSGRGRGSGSGRCRRGSGSGSGSGTGSGAAISFNDYLDGGAGNDFLLAGGGDDEVFHNVAENAGARDRYVGGSGIDTLTLDLTSEEWFRADVQADIAAFLQFVADNTRSNGEANYRKFSFSAFDLQVRAFENLKVLVDGVELDPADALAIANDDAETITEDATATTFASVLDNDTAPDLVKEVRLISTTAEGILVFNAGSVGAPDGSFSFDPAGDFNDLAAGETRQVSFTYEIEDANGDTDQATVTITVTGVGPGGGNTPPIVTADSDSATDDGVAATGNVLTNDSDPDTGDSLSVANPGVYVGTYGTLTLNADGSYSYTVTDESIDDGFSDTDVFAVQVTDGTATVPTTLTLNITGQNDAPVVTADSDSATDDGVAATGNVLTNDSDPDTGDSLSVANPGVYVGTYGTLTLNADGSYSYTVTDESIDDGFSDTDVFAVQVTDGTATVPTTLTLNITGQNDAPVVIADSDSATDDGVAATGNVLTNDSDPDAGDSLSVANPGVYVGTYGTLTLNADGSYSYTVTDESIDDGFSDTDVFAVQVTDGTATVPTTLTLNITGQNDAPVVTADSDSATDDGVAATGNVLTNDSDPDTGDSLSVANPGVYVGTYGTLTLNADGSYSYTVTDESIDDGFSDTDVFAVQVTDGTATVPTTLTLNITGQNDAPVVTADSDSATDDGVAATGNVLTNDSDPDAGDSLSVANPGVYVGTYGTLTLNADGSYSYTVTDESIDDGFSDTDVFAVQVTDGTATVPTTLTLNITGQNDAPTVVNDALVAPVNGSANGNVLTNDSDVDTGDSLTVSLAGGVAPGTSFVATSVGGRDGIATVQANGDITFNTNGNFVDLGGGAQDTVIINYTASDGTDTSVGQVVITVTGINDAPIAVDDSDSTDEDTAVTLAVLTNDSDPENDPITITMVDGQAIAPGGSVVLSGSGATVTLNVNGTLTYDPSGAFDHLADGAPGADSFSYTISDPDGETDTATVSIALTGVNDTPVAGDDSLDVFEGIGINISATGTGNLISAASDVDGTVTSVVEVDGVTDGTTGIAGLYGTLTWDALTGAYLYTVNDSDPTVHGLTAGSSLSETFDFVVQDDFGANSNTATLTVTINGVTDGLFTEQADTVDLSAAIQAFPQTAFENNFLNALGGDDTVVLVSGLEVSPYLSQFNGQTFSGDGGNDWITILNGNMNADGGTGRDTLDTSALLATTSAVRVDLGAGTVDIARNNTTDLTAINFEDVIGTAFADELISSAADNGIYAGAGHDIIRVRAGTTSLGDIYVGGAGTDSLINNSGSNLVFNSFDVTDLTGTVNGSGIETINTGILTILGTTGDDYQNYNGTRFLAVSTTASLFEVSTGDGNDTVVGSNQASLQSNNFTASRNDYDLGTGNDDFTGSGSIVDFVFGGTGSDTIRGGEGNDWLEGEEGGDLVQGDGGSDTLYLRLGHDSELDTLVGGAGSDTIVNGTGTDFLMSTFDFGDATGLVNGSGVEFINLSTRVLLGTTAGNMFDFAGARFIGANTTAANIEVSSGDGDDTIIGSSIAALQSNAFTAPQNDYDLGAGNDDFTGTGNVRDVVYGGTGNDTIRGEGGNDWFEGQAGADLMLGGLGNDTFYVRAGEQSELDHFAGGDGADIVINGVGLGFTMSFFDFDDATGLLNGSSVETIQLNNNSLNGTASGDFFDFDGTRFTAVNTTPSVFEVMSGDGNDTITGSSILAVQSNAFTATENNYDLGAGNDSFTGAGTVKDVVFGRAGNDTIAGGGGTDVLDGGADNDLLQGNDGADTLDGGLGVDRLEGGDGNDHIVLTAGSAHETEEYLGEAGTDRIVNNTGGDFTLTMVNTSMGGSINATGIEQIALNNFRMLGTATGDNFDLGGVQFLAVNTTLAATELDTGAGNDTVIGSGLAGIQSNNFGVSQFRYELGQGNDHFTGTGTITNVVFGEDGSDTLIGGNGVDVFEGGTGADSMDGGAGNDTFTLRTLDQSELDTIVGGAGSDTIINAAGANFIMTVFDFDDGTGTVNGSGVENINLASGTLFGTSAGNMFDFVGARFVAVNTAAATLEVSAGGGNDTIFGSAILGLQSNAFTAPQNDYDLGDGNDLFIGSGTVRDVVYGGIGNDTIQGEGGHDWFEGQAGADLMLGGSGNDTFYVRAGEQSELDTFAGGDGSDIIINGVGLGFTMSFFDFDDGTGLLNGSSVETIQLNNNSLNGTASGDFFDFAGTRFTAVNTTPAVFEVMSGDGNDTITGSNIAALQSNNFTAPQIDYDLGSGADSFTGAGVIKDVVFGRAGNDTINGGDGTDVLDGGADNDSLLGGLGNDTLDGGIGVDRVEGGDGDDQIILTAGSAHETEEYLGEAGTDRIVNNTGGDFTLTMVNTSMGGNINATGIEQIAFNDHVLLGTTGNDNFDFSAIQFLALNTNLANTEVNTGAGNDTVVGSSVSGLQSNNFSTNQLRYELGEGDDLFTVSGTVSNVVFGDGGSDTINGGAGADLFEGGSGGDSMNGGAGNDTFTIRTGDQLELDTIVGGLGTDTITNLAGVNFIMSAFDFDDATETVNGSGIEQINLVSGTLFGTATGNLFDFSGTRFVGVNTSPATLEVSAGGGNDTVIGTDTTALQSNNFTAPRVDYDLGDGDDSFTGSGAGISELILGGLGNDTITGGGGSDTMTGGAGDDIFIFTPLDNATNVVTDFEMDIDHVDVSALTDITDFTDLVTNHLSQSGADALISGANATAIRLTGINIALLDADDFIF